MTLRLTALAAATLLLAGCPGPDPVTSPPPCTGTYSGALSGTFACTVSATNDGSTSTIDVYASAITGGASDLVPLTSSWTGSLAPGAYTEATTGISSYSALYGPSSVYYATRNAGLTDFGSFTLDLASAAHVGPANEWEIHGTFDATMKISPVVVGAPDVTLSITF